MRCLEDLFNFRDVSKEDIVRLLSSRVVPFGTHTVLMGSLLNVRGLAQVKNSLCSHEHPIGSHVSVTL